MGSAWSAAPPARAPAPAQPLCPAAAHLRLHHHAGSVQTEGRALSGTKTGQCPFLHGTVHAGPFPGYVHGTNPKMCPKGCKPSIKPDAGETVQETLLREAKEYQNLFHTETKSSAEVAAARWAEIELEVRNTGTYTHTHAELEHGLRVAWRNAPKCANRKFHMDIKLRDKRLVRSNAEMFEACCEHLELALQGGVTDMYITCFAPAAPGERAGPRVWNSQLTRYAAYRVGSDMEVMGDPANLGFTNMLETMFGWGGPPAGRGNFDILPLVCQVDPKQAPELFELPAPLQQSVDIWHPQYPALAELQLKWYPVPAVSAMEASVGGLLYTGVPFNGWYADTEVVRDLCDEGRYDVLPAVAELLGLDVHKHSSLWRDQAQLVVNRAVLHSFGHACISMVDHHTLIRGFFTWYQSEMKDRGYCPGNWKWIIPPQAASTSPAYLQLNKMTEYTIKPAYVYAPGWKQYAKMWFGECSVEKANKMLTHALTSTKAGGKLLYRVRRRRMHILLIYASVSGNTRRYAGKLSGILGAYTSVEVVDLATFDHSDHSQFDTLVTESEFVILLTPTYGNGDVPPVAESFYTHLQSGADTAFEGKQFAVLGFGSSLYPEFCGGAAKLDAAVERCGGRRILALGRCDAQGSEPTVFHQWLRALIQHMRQLSEEGKAEHRSTVFDHLSSLTEQAFSAFEKQEVAVEVSFLSDRQASEHLLGAIKATADGGESMKGKWKRTASRIAVLNALRVGSSGGGAAAGQGASSAAGRESWLRGTVRCVTPLLPQFTATPANFDPMTTLVEVDISAAGNPPYAPGDHVSLVPRHAVLEGELQAFARHLGVEDVDSVMVIKTSDPEAVVDREQAPLLHKVLGQWTTLRKLLLEEAGWTDVLNMEDLKVLAQYADGSDRERLCLLGSNLEAFEAERRDTAHRWIDIFELFPSLSQKVPLSCLLNYMKDNHPRLYSVASSKRAAGAEVHICASRLVYKLRDGKSLHGTASNFLSMVEPGAAVDFKLHTVGQFHLPLKAAAPILMIGAGTGIAPHRGFWQERAAALAGGAALGPAALVFGCRGRSDFLFHDEVRAAQAAGALDHVLVAYSREEGQPKQYVQDAIANSGQSLRPLVDHPLSNVYICGASRMASAAIHALAGLTSQETIDRMKLEGRMHLDVFGILDVEKD